MFKSSQADMLVDTHSVSQSANEENSPSPVPGSTQALATQSQLGVTSKSPVISINAA